MLINTLQGVVFDPSQYKGRLVICVCTDNLPGYGVFSDRIMPKVEDPEWNCSGIEPFEIINNPNFAEVNQYHYAVIDHYNAVYVAFPRGRELILTENNEQWNVCFQDVTVMLPDYNMMRRALK